MVPIDRLNPRVSAGAPVALVLPGLGYTSQAPILYWPIVALIQAGYDVWSLNWHADAKGLASGDAPEFVAEALTTAQQNLPDTPEVVIGKSLGSYALPELVDSDVRAAWLTPLLSEPVIAAAARSASERHLLVGGTADPTWDERAIRGTRARIITVEAADHGLLTRKASWRESAVNQLDALEGVAAHLVGE